MEGWYWKWVARTNVKFCIECLKRALEKPGYAEKYPNRYLKFVQLGEYSTLLENKGFRICALHTYDRKAG